MIAAILLLGAVTWLATRVLVVKTDLEASQALVDQLQTEIGSGDFTTLTATSTELQEKSASAVAGTQDLTWRAAEVVPIVGANLKAVRAVSESIDAIVQDVAAPAVELVANYDITARDPVTGGFDITPLEDVQTIAETAQTVFAESMARMATVDASATVGPVSAAVTKVNGLLGKADSAIASAVPLLQLVGPALGADGPRTYLLAFQNNAESTALGGSAASYTLINVDKGAISIAAQGAGSQDLVEGTKLDVPVDQSAIDLFTDYLVSYPNTSTSRPDFPTAAELMRAYWIRDKGLTANGVISVDPLALARILNATGPIDLPSGDVLSSENAVSLLVHDVYYRFDSYQEPEKIDAFFQSAASAILNKVISGEFDMNAMITAVTEGVNQGSILAWSADPTEQQALDGTRIQGALPKDNVESTAIGVYYQDTSASKMDYFLQTAATTTSDICAAGPTPSFSTTVTLHSNLTADEANALPEYVSSGNYGPQLTSTKVFVYGPVGATLVDARVDAAGESTTVNASGNDLGRPVASFTAYLAPGESSTVTASFTGAEGQYGPLEVRGTPMINATAQSVEPACG
ncbi:DUF4012 domain-containing protein [Cryobacterium lactosi]|uniref:DUF4012 domain-containing protein n=1 Tax=Cryobacterium lactosi TaxID=1259202 RepID=A0A4R9BWS3_9MICO|nr:DUF4012 domain-containing protein [Cryobacterium lactosi]TFD91849.1 DUF4012 domain-containing protein [Cryobacterium lactosi]